MRITDIFVTYWVTVPFFAAAVESALSRCPLRLAQAVRGAAPIYTSSAKCCTIDGVAGLIRE
jgi:hypothetical protein